jgi:ArsR family transcriptional regulator
MRNLYMEEAQVFKTLSDSNRLIILELLKSGEMCACKLLQQFNISQSTISYHMKMLCECELVTARTEGKWVMYSLNKEKIDKIKSFFVQLI